MDVDPGFMARAIELAQIHHPHPNPRVGVVIVDAHGSIVGEGAHVGPGMAHAEVIALELAASSARGSTLYTTLEPCTVHGRTPPCVDAVVAAGVGRVVVGAVDPDDRVSGSGIERLRAAGVEVVEGFMEEETRDLDPAYFHHRVTGMPLVTLKYAMTLDGSVAAADSTSKWITGEEARTDAHRLRAAADAVVVGSGTLRIDDPMLDVRFGSGDGHQPRPVVVAGKTPLPKESRLWEREPLVFGAGEIELTAGTLEVVEGVSGRPDPTAVCRRLAEMGYLSVLLEGGPTLAIEWWRAGVIDRGVVYVGSKIGAGAGRSPFSGVFATMQDAEVVSISGMRSLGVDIRIDFERV